MTLDVAYSYCINLTEQEKISIDKQVVKNRMEIKLAVFLGLPFLPNLPLLPEPSFFPNQEVFAPQQIVKEAIDPVKKAVDGKVQEGLSHKSSSHLIKTGSGVLIGNK
jgi:hypothetical protein